VAVPARPCLCRSRPAVVRPPPCRGYVPAPAADPLRHTVVISRIRHTSQDAATKLHDGASYTSRRSRLELARRNFRHNDPARPPTGIGRPGSPPHPQGRTRRHRQHTGQPAWNRSPGAHSRGGNDAPLTQREAMIGAGRPPTDEQISQICARQLVSTRLAQAAPNGGYTRGRQNKPTARRNAPWRKYAAASAPRRTATPSLNSSKSGSRRLGGRMPRQAAGSSDLTPGSACSG
jgi:hypothetical protein